MIRIKSKVTTKMQGTSSSQCTSTIMAEISGAPLAMAAATAAIFLVVVVAVLRCRSKTVCNGGAAGRRLRLPPSPAGAGLPVVGNMPQMLLNRPVFRWVHRLLADAGGEIVGVRLGPILVVAVACPRVARAVLRKNDAVFADRPTTFAAGSLSVGYRSASIAPFGDQWKKMRRVLTAEVLSPATEHRLRGAREAEADNLVRHVHAQCGREPAGGAVDVRHVARHFCGNVIRRLTLGRSHFRHPPPADASGPGLDEVEHVEALFAALSYLDAFCVSDYFPALVGLDLDGHEKVIKGVMRTLNRLHDPIVEERVEEWRMLRKAGERRRDVADFLDVLASLDDTAGQPMLTVEEIKAETIDIMIATVDNPSNAVEWALAEMINKPEVMQKAMDELDRVVGHDRLIHESDVGGLNYLKACIREAFRLHPYHPFNPPRVAMEDTTIAGYSIPKGSQVILSRIGLGRNPKVWDNPLEFRPERHLKSENNAASVALTEPDLRFISFSTGRRGCPGLSLGTLITVMLFARLLQGFSWSKPPGANRTELREVSASLVLAEPLLLQARPRLPPHLYEAK